MKLLSIEGENFGVLDGRPLEFTGGLQVVYGPNEAGKSTLLRLIRETLFGFPARGHGLDWKGEGIAAKARLQLRDDRTLRFRRQMRNRDIITGQWEGNQESVDETTLAKILSGASAELFNNLFAFSLRELFDGEESLKNAGLGESLFTGGWGGLEKFRRVQKTLTSEREDLFKPRGRKQVLLGLQSEISERQREYREALVPPQEFDRTQSDLKRRTTTSNELKEELQELRRREQTLAQMEQAIPYFRQRESLQLQRKQLNLPTELTGDRVDDLRRLRERLIVVEGDIANVQLQSAGQQSESEAELTAEQQHLLDHAAAIRSLEQRLSQMQELEAELPKITRQREELQTELERELEQIGNDWSLSSVESLKVGTPQREQLQSLLETQNAISTDEARLTARKPDLEQQLNSARQQLEKLPAHRSLDSLEDLLDRGETWREQDRKRQDLEADIVTQRKEAQRLRKRVESKLRSAGATCESLPDDWSLLDVPLAESLESWRERWQGTHTAVEQSTTRVEKLEDELGQLRLDLAEFDRLHPQLDRQQLVTLRERRNAGWDLLRRRYIDADASVEAELQNWLSEGSSDSPAEEFSHLLNEADQLADLQFSQAELLARRDQLTIRIERQESQLADDQLAFQTRQSACDAVVNEWQGLWSPLGIVPAAPGPMLEWRQHVEQYLTAAESVQRLDDGRDVLQEQMAPFEQELRKAFPDAETLTAALKAARTEFDVAGRTVSDRARLETEVDSSTQRWTQLEDEELQLGVRNGKLEADSRKLLQELGLPEGLSLAVAERTLDSLMELQRSLKEQRRLETQEVEAQTRLADFQEAVKALLPEENTRWAGASATVTLSAIAAELAKTQDAELVRVQRESTARELARRLADLQQVHDQLEQQLQEKRTEAGLSAEADLTSTLQQFQEREQLDRDYKECEIHLQQLAVDAAQLEGLDEADLQEQRQQAQQERETKDQQYQEEFKQIGALQQKLQEWADSTQVDRLANRLEHLRSEFAQGVERWAPLALAEAMMQRALSRFEKHHQPRLLASVGDWLSRLTGGRYRQLQSSMEEPGVIRVVDEAGARRTPDELSTGTREQLFLAIRLAYVTDYASKHDPLPLVLDDVLVNFDEGRAMETLRAMQELGETHQILLLTCHRRTVELGRSLELDNVVELQPESLRQPSIVDVSSGSGGRKRRSRSLVEEKRPALFPPGEGPTDAPIN